MLAHHVDDPASYVGVIKLVPHCHQTLEIYQVLGAKEHSSASAILYADSAALRSAIAMFPASCPSQARQRRERVIG